MRQAKLVPTILCGGVGARLWPVSRDLHPKPFIRLADGRSLLQKAFVQGALMPSVKRIVTVTNRELFFMVEDELRKVNQGAIHTSFILEPEARNTAAAIAASALHVEQTEGGDAIMLVLPADHLIADLEAFNRAVEQAVDLALGGSLVTFGVRPTSAETGYGYIESEGHQVLQFVEKPDSRTAQAYVDSGRFLWNAGIFCFRAAVLLAEMKIHCPAILDAVRASMDASVSTGGRGFSSIELDARFREVPSDSIDYALMEKSSRLAVVPCDIAWADIGSWNAFAALEAADANGNRIRGEVSLHDVRDCHIQSEARVVGAVGLRNLIVVDTPDALLVADKSQAQDVKKVYEQLRVRDHGTHRCHPTVHRPWGTYTVLDEGLRHKIKRITVKPGASLSLQLHHRRNEHWVVVAGTALVTNGSREFCLSVGQSTHIPVGRQHRLANQSEDELVLIEVQDGEYLGEDDIVRLQDRYGRC